MATVLWKLRGLNGWTTTVALLCSIIISSYNKAQFVGLAVDSALAQTYPNLEVIVVDDGSTDDSVAVLKGYGDRIRLLAKTNGGQASSMNAGFPLSSGEIVLFLDCDDTLDADVMQRVVDAWTPETAKVHFRLRKILEDGTPIEGAFMPPHKPLPNSDVNATFAKFGLYPAPPTTGNAFARRFLDNILPLSESIYRAWPDTPLVGAAPLFGKVIALDGIGGSFRQTAINHSRGGIEKVEAKLVCELAYLDLLRTKFHDRIPDNFQARWPMHLKDRLILAKFSKSKTIPKERATNVAAAYIKAILQWPEYSWKRRVVLTSWACAVAVLPPSMLRAVPNIAGPNLKL